MLKVKYFNNPHIALYLYDRHLVASERLPSNNEVLIYFAKLFYEKLFLGMKLNYNDLPSEFFGPKKGWLCEHRGAKCDSRLPRPKPPLVSRPLCVENLWSEMDVTSQISQEVRDAIIDNVHSGLGGVDVYLNWQRARENAHANFVYCTDEEIDNMSVEDLKIYANNCCNGWQDLILHEE